MKSAMILILLSPNSAFALRTQLADDGPRAGVYDITCDCDDGTTASNQCLFDTEFDDCVAEVDCGDANVDTKSCDYD